MTLYTAPLRPDGREVKLPDIVMAAGRGPHARVLPNGTSVVYLSGPRGASDFYLFDLVTRAAPRRLTRIARGSGEGEITNFDLTADGTSIIFDRVFENSDLALINLRR